MNNTKLTGVMPALVTPFDGHDKVSETATREMIRFHLGKGVNGFYLCGSTGQGIFMTAEERRKVVEVAVDEVGGSVPVIAHIGSIVQNEAIALAKHAADAGAAAVSSIIPPSFANLEAIVRYFKTLAGATDVPLLPYFGGAVVSPLQIMKGLLDTPTIRGTKYTGPNMYEMTQIIELGKDPWWVFSGMDEQCVFAAMCGATGSIGSSYNVLSGVYLKIRELVAAEKQAEAFSYQQKANRIIGILGSYGYAGALREALGFLGFECGAPRPPEKPFDKASGGKLKDELVAADFETLSSM